MPFSQDAADLELAAGGPLANRKRPGSAVFQPAGRPGWRRRFAWRRARVVWVALACALVITNAIPAVIVVRGLQNIYVEVQHTRDVMAAVYRLDADMRELSVSIASCCSPACRNSLTSIARRGFACRPRPRKSAP